MKRAGRVPPAGFPVRWTDALSALGRARAERAEAEFAAALGRRLGAERVVLLSSGRAALVVLLRALRARTAPRRTVLLVPAFACPSLLASAFVAGLTVRCIDVDPETLRLDPRDLAREDAADAIALVAVHLLGVPERTAALASWARERGVALIDDAAQGFGGATPQGPMGTAGDAGILSFGRGKPLALLGGGALVASGDVARDASQIGATLPRGASSLSVAAAAAAYAVFRAPRLFAAVERLPGLEVGVTRYDPLIAPARFGGGRARLGLRLLGRLDGAREARRRRWEPLHRALLELGGPAAPPIELGSTPACLRYPLLAPSVPARDAIVASLRSAGLGASRFYPEPLRILADRHGLAAGHTRPTPGADALAERLVTLPVHDGVPEDAIPEVARIVAAAARTLGPRAVDRTEPRADGARAV